MTLLPIGMHLENYINADLGSTNITLLAGEVEMYVPSSKRTVKLKVNDPLPVGVGTHVVSTMMSLNCH